MMSPRRCGICWATGVNERVHAFRPGRECRDGRCFGKAVTARTATARARMVMAAATLAMIRDGSAKKGDVLGVARLAGIMAAKRTAELIPLCHPLPISAVRVDLEVAGDGVEIVATVRTCPSRTAW